MFNLLKRISPNKRIELGIFFTSFYAVLYGFFLLSYCIVLLKMNYTSSSAIVMITAISIAGLVLMIVGFSLSRFKLWTLKLSYFSFLGAMLFNVFQIAVGTISNSFITVSNSIHLLFFWLSLLAIVFLSKKEIKDMYEK